MWLPIVRFATRRMSIAARAKLRFMSGFAFLAATFTLPAQTPTTRAAQGPTEPPARKRDVIYVPTPHEVVDRMLELAKIRDGDIVYDLGCGDGRIVVTAAKRYGVKAVGFDIDPKRVAEARANVRKNGVDHLVTIT